ncbi:MAG: LysR family transcriptional regulator [Thiobacillaceae bacterium]|jgi:DNA-binding transcriptional LysR family regulator|nr:LysR family transcriptional regulator [Thiobacillaceae bacterium]
MDRFADMRMFVAVVDAGSISGAAERLEVAKSAVSRRLTDLEARLGAELLHRTTRRLGLTDSGRAFFERAQRILADLEEAEQAVSQAHGAIRGRLKVALPLSFGLLHLAGLINEFLGLHPEVEFDLDFNDRQIDLMQEGFDLAIRIARLPDSSLIARKLAPIRHALCASPDYLARHGTPARADDLASHAGLVYSNLANPGLWSYVRPDGQPGSVQVPVKLRANNGDFLCRAAIAGQGVILHPTFYLSDAIRTGELVPLLTDHAWPELNAYALYPPTRHLSRRVRAFVDFLAEKLAGEPYWDRRMR